MDLKKTKHNKIVGKKKLFLCPSLKFEIMETWYHFGIYFSPTTSCFKNEFLSFLVSSLSTFCSSFTLKMKTLRQIFDYVLVFVIKKSG